MKTRSLTSIAILAALVFVMVACGKNGNKAKEGARGAATSVANRVENATRLRATLSGPAEVPPGDPDGTGTATVNVDVTKKEICYEVSVQKIDHPVGMHIHEGGAGKSGDIVLPLTTPTASDTTTTGCANADAALIGRILANPGSFYLNVHTDRYPNGAVRGQLSQ